MVNYVMSIDVSLGSSEYKILQLISSVFHVRLLISNFASDHHKVVYRNQDVD